MKRHVWTTDEIRFLRHFYPHEQTKVIARILNISLHVVYRKAHLLNICKSESFNKSQKSGRLKGSEGYRYRYSKGHVPYNKGKVMKDDMKEKIKHTFFKKGHVPHNTKNDGAISKRTDRSGFTYQFIRIALGKWEHLHRYVWKKYKGEIPHDSILVFKDGNTLNCDISNLELITRSENMNRNSIHKYPSEIKEAIQAIKKLNKTISENEK